MPSPLKGTFRSLRNPNYRLWAAGALVSNVGTWMQRIAQDWLVLTELTAKNATAVGVVMALQFGPQLLFLPLTGWAADHLDRRKLLMVTQTSMGLLALGLGLLTLSGQIRLWQVDVFAFLLGCVSAFDATARQAFVADLVGETDLSNAVALNSSSFNAARMIGPAVAGLLIAAIGSGWLFILNALSFVAVLAALGGLRLEALHPRPQPLAGSPKLTDGIRYAWGRPDLRAALLMLLVVGTLGLNFPIFISSMAVSVYHVGAGRYGALTSMMAVGSVAGALWAARRSGPDMGYLTASAAFFGLGCTLAALAPGQITFGAALLVTGLALQSFTTSTNSLVQLSTDPAMRGRVMAILLAVALGSTPVGAPIVGWIADAYGPRWSLAVGASSGLAAALIGLRYAAGQKRPN